MLASDCHSPFPWRVPLCREKVKPKNHEKSNAFNKRRHKCQLQIVILGTRRCGAKKIKPKTKKKSSQFKKRQYKCQLQIVILHFLCTHHCVAIQRKSRQKKEKSTQFQNGRHKCQFQIVILHFLCTRHRVAIQKKSKENKYQKKTRENVLRLSRFNSWEHAVLCAIQKSQKKYWRQEQKIRGPDCQYLRCAPVCMQGSQCWQQRWMHLLCTVDAFHYLKIGKTLQYLLWHVSKQSISTLTRI